MTSDDEWTYHIAFDHGYGYYKVRVMRNGRQVGWRFALTKWGARRKAKWIKEDALADGWSERGAL